MVTQPSYRAAASRLVAGARCVDFVNTVEWRGDPEARGERLIGYGEFLIWAQAAGLIDATGHDRLAREAAQRPAAARKVMPWSYLTDIAPGPVFTGVERPMKVYSFDNVLIASAKTPEDFIYKILVTLEQNKGDLIAVQPVLREFGPDTAYKQYGVPYHPGALKYFKEKNLSAKAIE